MKGRVRVVVGVVGVVGVRGRVRWVKYRVLGVTNRFLLRSGPSVASRVPP